MLRTSIRISLLQVKERCVQAWLKHEEGIMHGSGIRKCGKSVMHVAGDFRGLSLTRSRFREKGG